MISVESIFNQILLRHVKYYEPKPVVKCSQIKKISILFKYISLEVMCQQIVFIIILKLRSSYLKFHVNNGNCFNKK